MQHYYTGNLTEMNRVIKQGIHQLRKTCNRLQNRTPTYLCILRNRVLYQFHSICRLVNQIKFPWLF